MMIKQGIQACMERSHDILGAGDRTKVGGAMDDISKWWMVLGSYWKQVGK